MAHEDDVDRLLRPQRLDEIVGQDQMRAALKVFIKAAKIQQRPVDHTLLTGRPGLGKTTFGIAIANEMERPLLMRNGPSLDRHALQLLIDVELGADAQLLEIFGKENLHAGAVVMIDEVHAGAVMLFWRNSSRR